MEILQWEDLGDTVCRLAANAVGLVLGWYQISITTCIRGASTYMYNFEKDGLNICRVTECRVFMSSWYTGGRGGGDA